MLFMRNFLFILSFTLFAGLSCSANIPMPPQNSFTNLYVYESVAVYVDGEEVRFTGKDYMYLDFDEDGDLWVLSLNDNYRWGHSGADLESVTEEGAQYSSLNGNLEDIIILINPEKDAILVAKEGDDMVVAYDLVSDPYSTNSTSYDYDSSSYYGSSSGSSYSSGYSGNRSNSSSRNSEKYDVSEQRAYNADKRTYSNYESMLSSYFAGNRSASSSEVRQWQSAMKNLRKKWESRGKSFPHSSLENR